MTHASDPVQKKKSKILASNHYWSEKNILNPEITHEKTSVTVHGHFLVQRTRFWDSDVDWGLYSRRRDTIRRSASMKRRENGFQTDVDLIFCTRVSRTVIARTHFEGHRVRSGPKTGPSGSKKD